MSADLEGLTKAEGTLLALLFSPGESKREGEAIRGRVILAKLLFLLWMNPVVGPSLKEEVQFEPYDYGPYSGWIDVALDELESRGLVKQERGKTTRISLTKDGLTEAASWFRGLAPASRSVIEDVKSSFGGMSTTELLERVYAAYPEYASQSKWKKRE